MNRWRAAATRCGNCWRTAPDSPTTRPRDLSRSGRRRRRADVVERLNRDYHRVHIDERRALCVGVKKLLARWLAARGRGEPTILGQAFPEVAARPRPAETQRVWSAAYRAPSQRLDSAAKNRCAPVVPLATGRQPKPLSPQQTASSPRWSAEKARVPDRKDTRGAFARRPGRARHWYARGCPEHPRAVLGAPLPLVRGKGKQGYAAPARGFRRAGGALARAVRQVNRT
jgi:hypothetical protein